MGGAWLVMGRDEAGMVNGKKIEANILIQLPQDATTEVKMIAGLVFATLNESWDKFKQQNGM